MTQQQKTPHHWVPSPYGHGESACTYCLATNREINVIGDMNHCPSAADHLAQGGTPHEETK